MVHRYTRARDADREAAVRVVSAAHADGQIDRAVHDERVERVRAARTLGELDNLLVDLKTPGGDRWVVMSGSPAPEPSTFRWGGASQGPRPEVFIAAVAAVIVIGIVSLLLFTG